MKTALRVFFFNALCDQKESAEHGENPRSALIFILEKLLLAVQIFLNGRKDLVNIQAVYGTCVLKGLVDGGRAAYAVHAGLHQHISDAAVIIQHFAHSGLLCDFHLKTSFLGIASHRVAPIYPYKSNSRKLRVNSNLHEFSIQ